MSSNVNVSRVLVALDGSDLAEQAVPYAAALARDGQLVFLHVLAEAEPVRDLLGNMAASSGEVADHAGADARAMLERTAEAFAGMLSGKPEIELAVGDPATEIARTAERLDCQLIVVASHGRGAVGRLAFGSVADALTRHATRPVLVVRRRDAHAEMELPRFGRVVAPYDGSELAATVFPLARTLAERLNVEIHLISVVSPVTVTPYPPAGEPAFTGGLLAAAMEESEAEAKAAIAAAQQRFAPSGVPVTGEVVMGSPFEAIAERVEPDDLIVIASHGRGGVGRWLRGSVAERLVREAPCPLVIAHGVVGAGG